MTTPLSVQEYRELLAAALPEATDADTAEPNVQSLFTPDSHRAALYVDSTVVRGGRGVGKTFWYRSLLDETLREIAAQEYGIERLRRVKVYRGYGASMEPDLYPGTGNLRQLMEEGIPPYDLWYAVLLTAFGQPELRELTEWRDKAAWVRNNPGAVERTIQVVDRQAQEDGVTHLVLFDALDHLHRVRAQADKLVGGILELALAMRLGTRAIRFKVFIRPDMYDGALLHFPDASKLSSNAAALTWSRANLYGLLFHTMGNADSVLAARFRQLTGGWQSEADGRRHVPPALLSGDEQFQTDQFTQVAGPYMGSNFRKGHTFTWLPNHLMDGVEQVSPRSFLSALQKALSETKGQYAGHEFALHHEGIRRGVQKASETRVVEVSEDMPWVSLAIEPLAGHQVPIEQDKVESLWEEHRLVDALRKEAERYVPGNPEGDSPVRTGPRYPENPAQLIEELIELGVMRRRADRRIDLPDVYRIAFGVGRKGGVPRVAT
ncbi:MULTISPECIES: hypothetical protein [unclassified Streptomyces]|uniref:hypothetical protein n=1 Tax=unclassified Streptomyces TaxID=2593676 RepID=UPI0006F3BB66|nr:MULTISPECIES: hypothetical protein [unclassified Streptomyces]KQX59121.1 hypothetical protein ASD33_02150 [Streptomyces sp. Root1304]KRB00382.1 hypothetical protein ASE09_02150 [Streptomyces sp. Root66D1]